MEIVIYLSKGDDIQTIKAELNRADFEFIIGIGALFFKDVAYKIDGYAVELLHRLVSSESGQLVDHIELG